jgi:hydrogenase nickel incorporation protein HypA/HybF
VTLHVGALRQVVPDSLAFYFELVARGTLCERARLELQLVPARLSCCAEWEPPPFRCPSCGAPGDVVAGDEFLVESITLEEEPCIART